MSNADDTYDIIIIGAGLNGLVTSAYLARTGQRVLVLERASLVGGTAITQEIHPGFRCDVGLHDAGWLNPRLVQDLGLGRLGLEIIQLDPTVFTPLPDGRHLALWRDTARTVESIRCLSKPDADRWTTFMAQLTHWASFLETVYTSAPPRLVPSEAAEWLALFNLGRRLRGLGKRDMLELLRTMPMSVADWLDDWFETDILKGALGASGVAGMMQGPRSPGTAFVMLHRHVGCRGVVRPAWSARGGIGELARALAEAARQRGAEIRTGARVEHILIKDGRATGVVLANGEEIAARRIVSSADPRHTLFDLVGPLHFDPDFVQAVRNIKFRGSQAKVNLALAGRPEFTGLPEGHDHLRGTILISPSLNYLERAYDDAKYGDLSHRPHLEIRIPTLADPTLAPPGGHVMSIFVQYAPYHLREGIWDSVRREALGDTVVETLAGYAPNIQSVILHRQVLTPLDLEQTFELTEGHLDHSELTLDQMLFMRPAPGWAQYRTPIHNLYLCGAGTHPGGRTAGLSGYNAAREILKDVRRDA